MAVRKVAKKVQPAKPAAKAAPVATGDVVEQRLIAFAEQLGTLVGTVQGKAEGWLNSEALSKEIGRIRDTAADLLEQVGGAAKPKKAAVKQPVKAAARPSRGPVDAPGKRHRKPPPQERIDKFLGEPRGKQMGQKSLKTGRRGA